MTQVINKTNERKSYAEFIEKIDKLDTSAINHLRKNCGNLIKEADAKAITIFYSCLPKGDIKKMDRWFAAACIHCLWKAGTSNRISLVEALGLEFAKSSLSESYLKRIYSLMDAEWEDDKYMLDKYLSTVKMVKTKGYAIDGKEVLEDLLDWNLNSKAAQIRWAEVLAKYV